MATTPGTKPFEEVIAIASELTQRDALIQVGIVVACVVLAWWLTRAFFTRKSDGPRTLWNSQKPANSIMFPVLAFVLVMAARWGLRAHVPTGLLALAMPIAGSLVVVRIAARTLRAAFPNSDFMLVVERTLSWFVWGAMVLWVLGILPALLTDAEGIKWNLGGSMVSLRSLVEGVVSAGVVLVLSLWLSSWIEQRLLAKAGGNTSLRKIAANGTRTLLLLVGTLLALSAAGIPLGALGVLSGAIGVGIGFGLQKLAANYISGFVILAERSLRIGDVVKVDGFEGRITDIATRYTVVRALDGRESIVPNEMLLTQRIENHSLANRHVLVTTAVSVAYGTDIGPLLTDLESIVAAAHPRILRDPSPAVFLKEFGGSGINLHIQFWIGDPENGQGDVRSSVNVAVLNRLTALKIDIPLPHMVVLHDPSPKTTSP